MHRPRNEISYIPPRVFRPAINAPQREQGAPLVNITRDSVEQAMHSLHKFGIHLHPQHVAELAISYGQQQHALQQQNVGLDAAYIQPLTTPSITTPIQFLQEWLPGFVHVVTQARLIDELVGITVQGSWDSEEIVQGVMELTGSPQPYSDYSNIPLSSWNTNFETRTIVRFEEGVSTGVLEEARAARMNVSSAESKRTAAGEALEITRNNIGFNGYNDGLNRTYGLLNDPNLPSYVTVVIGAGGFTEWATKTFDEIVADIRTWFAALRVRTGNRLQIRTDRITMALAASAVDQLSKVTSANGYSVQEWLDKSYPNTRVLSVSEFDAANGGENVAYLYLDSASDVPTDQGQDTSTDDKRTFVQVVPVRFQTIGVQRLATRTEESYSNATAGVLLKRPFNVYRASGI